MQKEASEMANNEPTSEIEAIYEVAGKPYEAFTNPSYPTDPRHYKLPVFENEPTDEEYEKDYKHRVKAFIRRDDAISFAYHCNLITVTCPVYEKIDGKWVYSSEKTGTRINRVSIS